MPKRSAVWAMAGTLAVSSSLSRSMYPRMEFRSLTMRSRSLAVSSRFARSATTATSFSVTFMFKFPVSNVCCNYELQALNFEGNQLIDARQKLRGHIRELGAPAGVCHLDGQDSIRKAQRPRLLRYRRAAGKRPSQQRRLLGRGTLQGVQNNFFQTCAQRLHNGL